MKILFQEPLVSRDITYGKFSAGAGNNTFPYGLACVARYVMDRGFEVEYLEPNLEGMDRDAYAKFITDRNFSVIGIGSTTVRTSGAQPPRSAIRCANRTAADASPNEAEVKDPRAVNRFTLTYSAGDHGVIGGANPQTVEHGGAGSAVLESLQRQGLKTPVLQLGLPDRYIDHGDPALQLASCGLNRDGILASIRARLSG